MEIGDRKLIPREILHEFADAVGGIKDRINQILFVINGKIYKRNWSFETFLMIKILLIHYYSQDKFEDTECEKD